MASEKQTRQKGDEDQRKEEKIVEHFVRKADPPKRGLRLRVGEYGSIIWGPKSRPAKKGIKTKSQRERPANQSPKSRPAKKGIKTDDEIDVAHEFVRKADPPKRGLRRPSVESSK